MIKNWAEYRKRIKPVLKELKEAMLKEVEQGVLLEGLTKLIDSNKESMTTLVTSLKVPTRSKSMSWEIFAKQLQTWTEISEEILDLMKYHDLVESLKLNKRYQGSA